MSARTYKVHPTEMVGLILLLAASALALFGLLLPVNEYSWTANVGAPPPDCDIDSGMVIFPSAIAFVVGSLVFGFLLFKRLSKLRFIGLVLSVLMLGLVGLKAPEYIREQERASQLCSK